MKITKDKELCSILGTDVLAMFYLKNKINFIGRIIGIHKYFIEVENIGEEGKEIALVNIDDIFVIKVRYQNI